MNVGEFEDSVSSETPTEIYSSEDEVGGENQVNEMCGIVCRYLFEQLFVIQMSHIEIFCFLIQGLKIRPWKTLADEVHNLWQVSEPALFVALKDTLPEAIQHGQNEKREELSVKQEEQQKGLLRHRFRPPPVDRSVRHVGMYSAAQTLMTVLRKLWTMNKSVLT